MAGWSNDRPAFGFRNLTDGWERHYLTSLSPAGHLPAPYAFARDWGPPARVRSILY